nr:unnamed protein product [Callosobruchus analis]
MYWAKMTKLSMLMCLKMNEKSIRIERNRKDCTSVPRNRAVAIDEQMIPFSGMCPMQQFVRGKPQPVGLKDFVCAILCVLDLVIYQGESPFLEHTVTNLGVGLSAVVKLSATLLEEKHIYSGRYFTTIPLIEYMLIKNMVLTGKIMKSKSPKINRRTR